MRNYPLLNMCLGKSGRVMHKPIHVIDSVTYIIASMCSSVQRRAKPPHYNFIYIALILYKFLLTYNT